MDEWLEKLSHTFEQFSRIDIPRRSRHHIGYILECHSSMDGTVLAEDPLLQLNPESRLFVLPTNEKPSWMVTLRVLVTSVLSLCSFKFIVVWKLYHI